MKSPRNPQPGSKKPSGTEAMGVAHQIGLLREAHRVPQPGTPKFPDTMTPRRSNLAAFPFVKPSK